MTPKIDHTHDRRAQSWVGSANEVGAEFPIQNLPLGIFSSGASPIGRVGVAIGDQILDLAAALDAGLLPELDAFSAELHEEKLNRLMACGGGARRAVRQAVFHLLENGHRDRARAMRCLVPMASARMRLPTQIGDFTDFFTSIHHARRTGALTRPDMPVAPNFRHMPIAYHGRASSVVESGVPLVRPRGQRTPSGGLNDGYVPTQWLDFELEVGCYVGRGNSLGSTIAIDDAEEHMFGLCLVNDWSARDIQIWESHPLGPFLSKSFMTTVSPWVVTLEALAPFRAPAAPREAGDPPLPSELTSVHHASQGGIAISLQAMLQTAEMCNNGAAAVVISQPQFSGQYWTLAQMLTHHASNGCNLRAGDLLSSGTVSGPEQHNSGCLVELNAGGRHALRLPSGESRLFLEDGDVVSLRGLCEREGYRPIGFGECEAQVAKDPK